MLWRDALRDSWLISMKRSSAERLVVWFVGMVCRVPRTVGRVFALSLSQLIWENKIMIRLPLFNLSRWITSHLYKKNHFSTRIDHHINCLIVIPHTWFVSNVIPKGRETFLLIMSSSLFFNPTSLYSGCAVRFERSFYRVKMYSVCSYTVSACWEALVV